MAESSSSPESDPARHAREAFASQLAQAGPRLLEAVLNAARVLLDKPAERNVSQQRRDNVQALMQHGEDWLRRLDDMLHDACEMDRPASVPGELAAAMQAPLTLKLVDDETVQREIYVSRLAQAISDKAVWELNDLGARVAAVEGNDDLLEHDPFRPHQLAKIYLRAFDAAGLTPECWAGMENTLKYEVSLLANEAYHDANSFLVSRGVMPEVNLRQLIRRSVDSRTTMVASQPMPLDWNPNGGTGPGGAPGFGHSAGAATGYGGPATGYGGPGHDGGHGGEGSPGAGGAPGRNGGGGGHGGGGSPATGYGGAGYAGTGYGGTGYGGVGAGGHTGYGPHTGYGRATTYGPGASYVDGSRTSEADATLLRFGRTMEKHVHGFMNTQRSVPPSGTLQGALASAQRTFVERVEAKIHEGSSLAPTEMIDALRTQKQALKQVAGSAAERATIEVVAMMFQNILTEERIPASVRVWFARLQMPTLRVAIGEPDFFSSAQHPARRLIDRMGACVMGFDAAPQGALPEIEAEVARVVQVVEAFPETGRKVFQTVLVEFERFLERYFRDHNETTKKGVSLASQVEQRETLAIQYTIELRKLLDGVPVQDGVRDFLFQVWADVLATTTMRFGAQSDETRAVREAALELVWIASAKTTREERAEVIRRLGPLLAALRQGMQVGGMPAERQETSLRTLNVALTAAFSARSATIDPEQLARLKGRLEALDEILPDADFEIDDSFALDLSGHDSDELEVVSEGGAAPSPAALKASDEMMVGAWYMLEYRERTEPVQLAWQGLNRQLSLFVSANGRCVLFQRRRLAAFLQSHLLAPAQDETLTVAATRSAIDKINADPKQLQ
jgi:Tfp pilus assembly protein PilE